MPTLNLLYPYQSICCSHVDANLDQPPPSSFGSGDTFRLCAVGLRSRRPNTPPNTHLGTDNQRGTPNSGTTSLSALSTTAIKDGHQGQAPPHTLNQTASAASTNTLDAERADRISRLAGLERVATIRGTQANLPAGTQVNEQQEQQQQQQQHPGYFDNAANQLGKERSTVGSASATGSLGGGTTWASGSDVHDADKMSEDQDDGVSSAGFSDEGNASLVGFGEGASSTISGPVSSSGCTAASSKLAGGRGSSAEIKKSQRGSGSPMQGVEEDSPRALSGLFSDGDEFDTLQNETYRASVTTQQRAGDVMRARLGNEGRKPLGNSQEGNAIGEFHFAER